MRAVTTATAAAVLSLDRKKLDNLLSRVGADRFKNGRQGVERRIPISVLEEISLTAQLSDCLSIPAREAFAVARQLLGREVVPSTNGSADTVFVGSLHLGPFVNLGVNLHAFRADLHARLELAIESQVRPRRGRPKKPQVRSGPTPEIGEP